MHTRHEHCHCHARMITTTILISALCVYTSLTTEPVVESDSQRNTYHVYVRLLPEVNFGRGTDGHLALMDMVAVNVALAFASASSSPEYDLLPDDDHCRTIRTYLNQVTQVLLALLILT